MEGELQRTFGENLRAYRKARGLTQEQLADEFNRTQGYIGSIERGERNLSLRLVERLAALVDGDPLTMLTPQPSVERDDPPINAEGPA
ncbi:MAG: helix-turn-helix transcriptional regulator [Solirubrobacterales bacterium]